MSTIPAIIAHRGASFHAPENTLPSFAQAWTEKADGIEADFHLTRDGHIVCIHDDNTRRTAGIAIQVAGALLSELRLLDVGGWKGKPWQGARIPTLGEVLADLPPKKLFFIELKGGAEMLAPLAQSLAGSAVQPEQIRLLSFDSAVVAELKRRLPDYKTCWLTDYRRGVTGRWSPSLPELMAILQRTGADGLASRSRSMLDKSFVQTLQENGKALHIWTVDDPLHALKLSAWGVDSIITNRPGLIRDHLHVEIRRLN